MDEIILNAPVIIEDIEFPDQSDLGTQFIN